MKYQDLSLMFQILKNGLGIKAELLSNKDHEAYQTLLCEKGEKEFLGLTTNIKYSGSKVITPDLFKPEQKAILDKLTKNHTGTRPVFDNSDLSGPLVFINTALIEAFYKDGRAGWILKTDISGWCEYPLSLRTVISSVIVHELTHCQMELEKVESCSLCLYCQHCGEFRKRMQQNWTKILEDNSLQKIDYAFYGNSVPTFSSEL